MAELGNVFDALDEAQSEGGTRGADLFVEVEVDPRALGVPAGQQVPVPDALVPFDDRGAAPRARKANPHDPPGHLCLQLPEGFVDGRALKLRGQGEAGRDGGAAGDLVVQVRLKAGGALAPRGRTELATRASALPWAILGLTLVGLASWLALR